MLVGCGCLLPFQMVSTYPSLQAEWLCFQRSKPLIKTYPYSLRTILSPKPDGTPPLQITDYNHVCVSLRTDISSIPITLGRACATNFYCLSSSLTVFQSPKLFGNIADGRAPAAFPDIHRKALGVEWIVRQKVKTLLLHPCGNSGIGHGVSPVPEIQYRHRRSRTRRFLRS